MDVFVVKSALSAASLEFHLADGDSFVIDISTPAVGARKAVYERSTAEIHAIARYFYRLAVAPVPWEGDICWVSLEGDFMLEADCDQGGGVRIKALLFDTVTPEPWSLEVVLKCEAARLRRIARDAAVFFDRGPGA
ncbi:DUF6228 family protein [Oceaniglobus indicus]|uniref:DUF6228 family protein n=1 Tax=Oceaniglobus indicus TaxID=2047749 RepID=UPI000C190614|nr:DUF6228 family protein [Oceaniglobus indicus]